MAPRPSTPARVPDPSTGAIMTPVYLTSTYVQESPGKLKGYDYSRTCNPTRSALEANLAALEDGAHGLCFSSGMAAINTVLNLLQSGDHVICSNDLYGGSYRICTTLYQKFGLEFTFLDMTNLETVRAAMRPETRLLMIESPSNPLLRLTDLAAVASLCKARSILTVCDNTFATPYNQQPLRFGIDMVVHSTTKYIGGHSDVIGGAIVVDDDDLHTRLAHFQNTVGGTPGPMDCFLTMRGTKTLHCAWSDTQRMPRQSRKPWIPIPECPRSTIQAWPRTRNTNWLSDRCASPGAWFPSSSMPASMTPCAWPPRFELFALAESLGGVESLVDHPATMTHGSIPREERIAAGFQDGLIRLSVGVEDLEDLLADLHQGIALLDR